MATPVSELVAKSTVLLEDERVVISERILELQARVDVHQQLLQHLEEELASERRLLREIEELHDRGPQLRLERLDRQLRGRRLQEVAVEVLRRRRGDGAAVHYREWLSLLRAEGFEIAGRDPMNTFLTNLSRAPDVEALGSRSGLYRLRSAAGGHLADPEGHS